MLDPSARAGGLGIAAVNCGRTLRGCGFRVLLLEVPDGGSARVRARTWYWPSLSPVAALIRSTSWPGCQAWIGAGDVDDPDCAGFQGVAYGGDNVVQSWHQVRVPVAVAFPGGDGIHLRCLGWSVFSGRDRRLLAGVRSCGAPELMKLAMSAVS